MSPLYWLVKGVCTDKKLRLLAANSERPMMTAEPSSHQVTFKYPGPETNRRSSHPTPRKQNR